MLLGAVRRVSGTARDAASRVFLRIAGIVLQNHQNMILAGIHDVWQSAGVVLVLILINGLSLPSLGSELQRSVCLPTHAHM